MKNELFDELRAGLHEGRAILRGEKKPSRAFVLAGPSVKRIRATYQLKLPFLSINNILDSNSRGTGICGLASD